MKVWILYQTRYSKPNTKSIQLFEKFEKARDMKRKLSDNNTDKNTCYYISREQVKIQ